MKKYQFGGLLNLLNLTSKLPAKNLPTKKFYPKLEPLEPDVPVNNTIYGPYNLPGITVTAPNLKKSQQFPYGEIMVEKLNGQTLAYPTGTNPLQEAVFKNKASRQLAYRGKLMLQGGELKPDNTRVANQLILPIPRSLYGPNMKFLYDGIFTDDKGNPFEYKEMTYNPNDTTSTWEHYGSHSFRKRHLSPLEANAFLEKKRTQMKLNDFRYALRNKFQTGGNLPTAPKAEIRYQNGVKDSVAYLGVPFKDNTYYGESIKRVSTPNNAKIQRLILFRHYPYPNDTIYREVPEHSKYRMYPIKTNILPRQGFSYAKTPEYNILEKRFNTAWRIAK